MDYQSGGIRLHNKKCVEYYAVPLPDQRSPGCDSVPYGDYYVYRIVILKLIL